MQWNYTQKKETCTEIHFQKKNTKWKYNHINKHAMNIHSKKKVQRKHSNKKTWNAKYTDKKTCNENTPAKKKKKNKRNMWAITLKKRPDKQCG